MTKYLFIACFFPFILVAQPSIRSTVHAPTIGQSLMITTFQADENEIIETTAGESGANKSWNFSSLRNGISTTSVYIDPNTLQLKDEIKILDANIGSRVSTEDGPVINLLKVTPSEIISKGLTNDTFIIQTAPSPILMKFPFNFGDNFETSNGFIFGDSLEFVKIKSKIRVDADAYGSITTAAGVFDNVLRVRNYSIDSITLSFGENFTFNLVDTTLSYQWFSNTTPGIVFQLDGFLIDGELIFDGYAYLMSQTTNLDLTKGIELNIYPNPFVESITIDGYDNTAVDKIQIYNNQGQKVVEKSIEKGKSPQLDLSYLPIGNYYIQISDNTGYNKTVKVTKAQ